MARTGQDEFHFPRWARSRAEKTCGPGAAFAAGASLSALDRLVHRQAPWHRLWLDRLSLSAALGACRALGRTDDEASLRDAICLCAENGDPGPAGRCWLLWRSLVGCRPEIIDTGTIATAFATAGIRLKPGSPAIAAALAPDAAETPVLAAAAVLAAVEDDHRPEATIASLWLADLALSRRLEWPVTIPLLSTIPLRRGGRPTIAPPTPDRCFTAVRDAAATAILLATDLDRKATALQAVVPKLRAKSAPRIITRLLEQDAMPATGAWPGMSERSLRRLFERLQALGVVRELTGRPAFRLYGL